MNTIPLVDKNSIESINVSLVAIKKALFDLSAQIDILEKQANRPTDVAGLVIDDAIVSDKKTWSSEKTQTELNGKTSIDDSQTSAETTFSSAKIQNELDEKTSVDDSTVSAEKTFSSAKIEEKLGNLGYSETEVVTDKIYNGQKVKRRMFIYSGTSSFTSGSGFRLQNNLPIPKENIVNLEGVFIRITDAGTPAYFITNCDCYVLQDNSLNGVQRISTFSGQYLVRAFVEYI